MYNVGLMIVNEEQNYSVLDPAKNTSNAPMLIVQRKEKKTLFILPCCEEIGFRLNFREFCVQKKNEI